MRRVFPGLFLILVLGWIAGWAAPAGGAQPARLPYLEVPGLTAAEAAGIENLRRTRTSLILGVPPGPDCFLREDGSLAGSAVLVAGWLSDFFGIPVEISVLDSDRIFRALESREIDLTASLILQERRQNSYYMTGPLSIRAIMYAGRQGEGDILSPAVTETRRLGILSGTLDIKNLLPHLPKEIVLVSVSSYEEAIELLAAKKLDVFFFQDTDRIYIEDHPGIISRTFLPLVFANLGLAARAEELFPAVDAVSRHAAAGGLKEIAALFSEGELEYRRHSLIGSLTQEEKAYLKERTEKQTPVAVGLESDNYPLCFYNQAEQQWQGAAPEVLAEIGTITGLTFQAANGPEATWTEILEDLSSGRTQMVSELIQTEDRRSLFIWPDEPYTYDNYSLVSLSEKPDVSINQLPAVRVGLIYNNGSSIMFKTWFPDHDKTEMFSDVVSAYDALERGDIDVLMNSRNQLAMMTNYLERPIFRTNRLFAQPADSYFGFSKDEVILKSIISKAQKLVDCAAISDKWIRRVFDYRGKLARAQVPYLVGLSVLMAVILLLVLVLLQRRRQLGQRLEMTVRERTRELAVQTLNAQEAEAAAMKASLSKSEFLANISHEIRTPMNAILGLTRLCLDTSLSGLQYDYVFRAEQAARDLLRIINDVLDFSKIETGRLEMEEIEFSLGALVKKCLGLYQAEAAGKGVALLSDIRAGVPAELEGDPVRLGQILSHLVSNAVKFTAKGQVKLIAEKIEDEEKSVFLRFTVEDTGIGLDQDKIDSLFTAFFQEDSSTTRKFGGTGLGLVISKRLLEMMGGKIWCESRKGAGSRFIFTARFRKPVPAGSQGAIPLSIRQPFLGLSCLAVDDNNMALAILEKALKVLGFAVVKAESGEEAVEYFIRQDPMEHFDLIVVDWKMPGIDGIETVRRISSQTGRLPPVLMLTAFEKDEVSGEVWEAGIKSVLTKPISLISLNESLTALLGAEETVPPEASRLQPEGGPEPEMDLKIRGANVLLAVKGRERVLNYSRLLTQAAVRFKIVDTGQEAVDAVQSDRYDLVFMDEQLPEMDGLTAAAVIRSFGQFRDLSIAGLAGDDQESSRQRCLDAGMNYCLPQSAGPAEFFKILSQLINPLDPAGTNHLR